MRCFSMLFRRTDSLRRQIARRVPYANRVKNPPKILFVNPAGNTYGSERSMLALLAKAKGIKAEAVCPAHSLLSTILIGQGIRTYGLEFNKHTFFKRPDWHLRFFLRFRRILAESRPDVVVVNLDGNTPLVTFAAIRAGIPIVRFSRLEFTPPHRWIDRYCWLNVAAVVCPSELVRQQVIKWVPIYFRERVHRWYDPLAISAVSETETRKLKSELGLNFARVIGFVGRLHFRKGIETAFRALAEIRKQVPGVRLLIVGSHDGSPAGIEYARKLEALTRELGVQDAVQFLGFRDDVSAVMSVCDVCVLPSESESFGMVLTEAWAMGVPTVASDVGGCREITLASGGGRLSPVGKINKKHL